MNSATVNYEDEATFIHVDETDFSAMSRPEQIRPALERAAASGKPACINVEIRQDREYKGGIYV